MYQQGKQRETPAIVRVILIINAADFLTAPEARGRLYFSGCLRSSSISR